MAISSKDVNRAENEFKASKQVDVLDQIVIPTDIQPEQKQLEVYNVLFKLVKKKRGRLWLDNCCDNVPNPANNNVPERIWLLNGATSIWESKLEHILKDKARYERARRGRDIVFTDGVCRVRSSDVTMLEFMRKCTHNVGKLRRGSGKCDFYEYDPEQEQKKDTQSSFLKLTWY